MKLGGLFSGIGGFELAWTRLGGEVAWMCEVDPKARKVLEARFPGVPIYPDVQELDPAEVEAVDVLTGGSPCQGFSVAGQRQGLLHGESRLFADYVRIVDGLAQRGLQYALWENVPGVLSIKNPDGERTFPHVIGALAGGSAAVRLDPRRKWNVGLVADGGRAVAWRVLDSRYFGVAQRRRRVFACVAFGDSAADRAGRALLAVAEGVRGDSAAGVEAGQGAAGGVAAGVGSAGGVTHTLTGEGFDASEDGTGRGTPLVPDRVGGATWWDGGDTAEALTRTSDDQRMPDKQRFQAVLDVAPAVTSKWAKGTGGPSGDEAQNLVTDSPAVLMTMREGAPGGGKGPLLSSEESLTLATGNGQTLFQPAIPLQDTREVDKKQNGLGVGQEGDPSFTLDTTSRAGVAQAFDEMNFTTSDQHHVLRAGTKQSTGVVEPFCVQGSVEGRSDNSGPGGSGWKQGESFTLNTADRHSIVSQTYGVRRLTPVECERLQAFPDGWTEPAGSDSARYKALGNAVTVNTVGWILRRMKALM